MTSQPVPLRSSPGIKRDGTKFDGNFYVDGQWVRFQRGLPRKIGGYRVINRFLSGACRGFSSYALNNTLYCHSGSTNKLERFTVDANLVSSVVSDRSPVSLTASDDNQWMFDYQYDATGTAIYVIAHVSQNHDDVVNNAGGQIFYGDVTGSGALSAATLPAGVNATGGIVVLHPYLFYYGSDGLIGWSVANTPSDLTSSGSGQARPWGQKIIRGIPIRSTGGPAGLFIAYDAVLRATFEGGSAVFAFDVIATETSIMSAKSVIDFDGIIFWAGIDRFMMFNGVVQEVPNSLNLNYFFDNIRLENRSKVFAVKVPKYGEIWWCYPRGGETQCSHAVIYNVRERTWYDTALPASYRVAGQFSNFTGAPIMVDNNNLVWAHENGVDAINGTTIDPIDSYFETSDLSALLQGRNKKTRITRIEPDFVQVGDMSAQVTGRANARAAEVEGTPVTFPAIASEADEQIVALKEQRRELRVKFRSNVVGGDYQMGQVLAHLDSGDERELS